VWFKTQLTKIKSYLLYAEKLTDASQFVKWYHSIVSFALNMEDLI